ncbi:hypothetical protein JWG42_19245, partial [Desulfoprunum benzoelyticum]|uniref:hypothetical protein n=1 Tax=Desulfoprunum benzoelyticum TaxID=1506996 RepID=UPI0019633D80
MKHGDAIRQWRWFGMLLLFVAALGMAGCSTTMGVRTGDPRDIYGQISISAISADECSRFSLDVLSRFDLVEAFEKDPVTVLTSLHEEAVTDYRTDTVFALAELSYLAGMRARSQGLGASRPLFFASVFYAYQ